MAFGNLVGKSFHFYFQGMDLSWLFPPAKGRKKKRKLQKMQIDDEKVEEEEDEEMGEIKKRSFFGIDDDLLELFVQEEGKRRKKM